MRFDFDEDLSDAQRLADDVFGELATIQRVREVEDRLGGFDPELWRALAETGLLALSVPDEHGGAGMGFLGLAAVLERQGRFVAPVPLAASIARALLPLTEYGTDRQRERWVTGALEGSVLLTSGVDASAAGDAALRGVRDGDGWRVTGSLAAVPVATFATAALVAVSTDDGVIAAIVPLDRDGIARTAVSVTDRTAYGRVDFDHVHVGADEIVGAAGEAIARARMLGRIANAALAVGVTGEAVARAAAYTSERVQFDRPLSTNQAVSQRAADAHLDSERITLATRKAAWLVDAGDPGAESASLVAAWWAARGGLRAVHATQHLHGGLGADIEYPIHRYFLWGRQIAFSFGTAASIAAELGAIIENVPQIGAPA